MSSKLSNKDLKEESNPKEGWDSMFKEAIAKGQKPENDVWGNNPNEEDEIEWIWD